VSIELKVYDNGDHTCLVWLPTDGKPIPDCRGFTVHRTLKVDSTAAPQESHLHGFVGFSDDDKFDPSAPWKFPVQRFMWWDYGIQPGNIVQYAVVPVCGPDKDHLSPRPDLGSAQTPPMTITGQASAHVSAYFNKGIVSSQWVSRALAAVGEKTKLADHIAKPGAPLREALSGLLRPRLIDLLAEVKKSGGEIYAALYELNDPELIPALKSLGKKCHLVLANGAFKPPENDENKDIRKKLRSVVDLHDRLVPQGHFAHNKFIVICDSEGQSQRVLSGSTNWTMTGLCTQANNGIIIDDPKLAAYFLEEWKLLKAAGNAYPPSLAKANGKRTSFNVDGGTITQWFAPTDQGQDLEHARELINGAEQGILFLFFNPGVFVDSDESEKWTLLQSVVARHQEGTPHYNPALYIHGVVNQEIAGLTTAGKGKANPHAALDPTNVSPVKLFADGKNAPRPVTYDSMIPSAIKNAFHNWQTEVMNQGVHVHSKVLVIDPFGNKPVVITGSHNLGHKASSKNDDNMVIVEGNAPLAAAYAINIIAIYQAYRWNTYVTAHAKDPQVWHGLVDDPKWQESYLALGGKSLAEIKFWLGEGVSAPAATGQPSPAPAAGGRHVRAATATGPAHHATASTRHRAVTKTSPKGRKVAVKRTAAKKARVKKAPTKKSGVKTRVGKKVAAKRRTPVKKRAK
jgi:PLD-like domain